MRAGLKSKSSDGGLDLAGKRNPVRRRRDSRAGISLLEVLIAVSLVGICFTALFSSFSTALRTAGRLDRSNQAVRFASNKLRELTVDAALEPGQVLSGVSEDGLRWQAHVESVGRQSPPGAERNVQLVRIVVTVFWPSPAGGQSFSLETLKLCLPAP